MLLGEIDSSIRETNHDLIWWWLAFVISSSSKLLIRKSQNWDKSQL